MDRRRFLEGTIVGATAGAAAGSQSRKAAPGRKSLLKAGHQHHSSDPELRVLAALGVQHICSALPSRNFDDNWSVAGLSRLRERVEKFGIQLDMVPLPLSSLHISRVENPHILNLDPPPHLRGQAQQQNLDFLADLNRRHLRRHPGEMDLETRIGSYELAASMQTAAKEALDISQEPAHIHRLYGIDREPTRSYGTRCLIARRLIERGVRFVQLFLSNQPWDNHGNIGKTLPDICRRTDQPAAALVADLKQRGLLETTIVHWGGEIGRLPVCEGELSAQAGRDHNGQGFSIWLAGGGIKGGIVYGATDEVGHRAAVNVVTPNDYQATLLHLLGLDHTKLVYQSNGREQRLIDGRPARIVKEILA